KTRYFIEHSNCSVGVFVNRGFTSITSTLVLLENESDAFLLRYARRLLKNNPAVVINIMDVNKLSVNSEAIRKAINELKSQFPSSVRIIKFSRFSSSLLSKYSFMLISYQAWNTLSLSDKKELEFIPSTLIINKKVSRFHTGAHNKIVENVVVEGESEEV
ncbi:MAG: cation/H(+) antiporter, partial [Paludibacter sp.]